MRRHFPLLSALALLFTATRVFAALPVIYCGGLPGCSGTAASPTPFSERISNVLVLLLNILPQYVEGFGVLFIMVGGAYILLSAGNAELVTKGKNTITWAVIAIFIAQFAGQLVGFVRDEAQSRVGGADLVDSVVRTLAGSIFNLFQIALIGVAIFSGMRMVLSFGKEEEFKKGQDGLFYAALGAIIINLSFQIYIAVSTL